ncbi:MAG TPA: hypothetical protein VLA89_09950 [Gemmatimonadales bacterium]|nr:hypothetical protein [Gemmatimonadales bacterium]
MSTQNVSKRPPLGDEGLGSHPTAGESPAPKPHSTLYRYDVKFMDGEDWVGVEDHKALIARYNDLVEQLQASLHEGYSAEHWHREYVEACKSLKKRVHQGAEAVRRERGLREQLEAKDRAISQLEGSWRECSDHRERILEQLESYERVEQNHLNFLAAAENHIEELRNGCEQALLLLERQRFEDDPEAKVVRAVLKGALGSNPATKTPWLKVDGDESSHYCIGPDCPDCVPASEPEATIADLFVCPCGYSGLEPCYGCPEGCKRRPKAEASYQESKP